MEAFGVFQGGGVRGIGLVGALEVLSSEYEWDFSLGVAGTSAGAIVAALYATRWPTDDMIRELQKKDFIEFLDGFTYSEAKQAVLQLIGIGNRLSGRLRQ